MRLIAENPGLARDASSVSDGLLKIAAGSHIAYFRISGGNVSVTRVLHGKMDPQRWL